MPLIREAIVITVNALGEPHFAPLGLIAEGEAWILAPFHPSTTLDNLRQAPFAVANFTDDVRVFAGCLTGRRDWPLTPATFVAAPRLAATLSHLELVVVEVREHELRPRFVCRVAHRASHAPFQGFNRAQAAVIEGAVLVSRLHMLPRAEVEAELARLDITVGKTAGPAEAEAWSWLKDKAAQVFAVGALGGRTCRPFQSLTSCMARSSARGWAIGRPTGRSNRRFRQPATRSMSCAACSRSIPSRRFMSPISTRSRATATISRRCAAFAQSFQHCKCGLTTARPTLPHSRLSSAPISGRRSLAANPSVMAS